MGIMGFFVIANSCANAQPGLPSSLLNDEGNEKLVGGGSHQPVKKFAYFGPLKMFFPKR